MQKKTQTIAVIGAGPMGLATAYHALKAGYKVNLYEADNVAGGMAAHFDFGGISLERFYHFVCKADKPTFMLLEELGIAERMVWVSTSMGYFVEGKHYAWGDPISLLKFPLLNTIDKVRYSATIFFTTKRKNWDKLENVNAKDWLLKTCGKKAYALLWERLFALKFFEFSDNLSAAWIATRIKRIGTSRRSLGQEELGYIEGGSETLVRALCEHITAMGGEIHLGQKVEKVIVDTALNRVTSVRTKAGEFDCDQVISTIPTPYVNTMVPDLPQAWKDGFNAIKNIGCICVVIRLRKKLTEHFWLNINDKEIEIPGLVEFSNLRNFGKDHIVYLPYYLPQGHPRFSWPNESFVVEAKLYLKRIKPELADEEILDIKIARLRHAQPVCEPGFKSKIPPIKTPITGLRIADTCYYYPEDRGISESVRLAREIVESIIAEDAHG